MEVFYAELLQTGLAFWSCGVELALHHVVFMIDMRQPARRLDEDQSVHSVRDVLRNHRAAAVVSERPGCCRFERKGLRLARRNS